MSASEVQEEKICNFEVIFDLQTIDPYKMLESRALKSKEQTISYIISNIKIKLHSIVLRL